MEVLTGYSDVEDQEAEGDRVILNVSGVRFETYVTTLQNIADTRLAWIIENVEEESLRQREFFFDRHPGAFAHILNFYRTGKLHTPTDMCGPAFEEELQFWGIDEKQMEPCCWETFTKHREAESNLKTFEGPGFEDLQVTRSRKYSNFSTFDDQSFMKRNMKSMWALLNDPHSSILAKRFSLLSCGMIIISLSVYCLLTMPSLKNDSILTWINQICLTFFTIEFVLRVIVCPRKRQFVKDYQNWIDFLSIIPSYLMIAFPRRQWIYNLVIIRLLRVFKFFKLSYGLQVLLHTLKASSYELTLLLLILLIPLVVFSSLVYAFEYGMTEGKTDFDSIPRTFWWAIVTMTTVGYGDLAPKTWAGQLIGSICAIISVLIIALPISVIGNNFNLYYAHVRARLKLPKKNRHLLQGRLRGLLRQPAMLSSRDRDRKNITRRNNGTTSSLSINGRDGGKLTVERAQTPSPFLQLRRGGTSGMDKQSKESECIEFDNINKNIHNDSDDSSDRESQKELPLVDRRDSVVSTSLSVTTDDCTKTETQSNFIVNDSLQNMKKGNETPLVLRNSNERKRKRHIDKNIMNGFPTGARRAAVGLPVIKSFDSSLTCSGSSGSLILPSVTVPKEDAVLITHEDEQIKNCKSLTPCRNDSPLRRESMKKMDSIECTEPPSLADAIDGGRESLLRRSSTCDSNVSGGSFARTDECNSVSSMNGTEAIFACNNNSSEALLLRKNSSHREFFRHNCIHALRRSNTETNFTPYSLKHDLHNQHSWSIDDILRNRKLLADNDISNSFLRESGV